ncbi:glutamyl-tRNA reductase [Clostridium polyendosporum]|uniref:Glutamyl-tRNA reductase n=1 Tax=Clostridium polyendosporum TaxID=69208 RepID=A0A919VEV9_9CLOT|nr:glutamyl-tRNA reductase [Clostridium polyendosporum]GIM27512.1 glutamyl-tRNA reductase [Clostridium polyendosporum]
MIQLIGLKKGLDLSIREKLSTRKSHYEYYLKNLLEFCAEAVIISTCNRTEIYFNCERYDDTIVHNIFKVFGWDNDLKEYTFHSKGHDVIKHLMEVVSGFHSKILGEDQILGQVKEAYSYSLKESAVSAELHRLFQEAITCGKEFRTEARMYDIPVSSSSIVVNYGLQHGIKNFMVIGYGEIGSLAVKYLLSSNVSKVYIVVRDPKKIVDLHDKRVHIIGFKDKNEIIEEVECIISCTSAPHYVIKREDIPKEKKLLIFDLAVPRDVEESLAKYPNIELLDIDTISKIDDKNKKLRAERMDSCRGIIKNHIDAYEEWRKLREITPYIKKLKMVSAEVSKDRINTFIHKSSSKNHQELAKKLIKSTSDFYINRAIETLKEAKLEGSEEQCLRIIEKIFRIN